MKDKTIEDGFGNAWSITCPTCGQDTMEIVRPGKVQCAAQNGPCSLPHCTVCGFSHENPGSMFGENRNRANCPCHYLGEGADRFCATHYGNLVCEVSQARALNTAT